MPWLFELALAVHVGAGIAALTSFWGAVLTAKGGPAHRRWGRIFATAIYAAAVMALAMGSLSLVWPLAMHTELTDATLYRGMFGTMMVYLGLLVLSMTRYGLMMVANRRNHDANRHWSMLALQGATLLAAAICLGHGVFLLDRNGLIMETALMILVALLGFGTTLTYFRYILARPASPRAYVGEHLKAMVATGIAAYTAFLSVGLIELFPEHAFNPVIWAVPTVIGVGIIGWYLRQQDVQGAASARAATPQ
jgi:glucose-6-phosphate-specific signal transduction histidine kinase